MFALVVERDPDARARAGARRRRAPARAARPARLRAGGARERPARGDRGSAPPQGSDRPARSAHRCLALRRCSTLAVAGLESLRMRPAGRWRQPLERHAASCAVRCAPSSLLALLARRRPRGRAQGERLLPADRRLRPAGSTCAGTSPCAISTSPSTSTATPTASSPGARCAPPGRASRPMRCARLAIEGCPLAAVGRALERRNDGAYAVLHAALRVHACRQARRESRTACSPTSIRPTAASPRSSAPGRRSRCRCSSRPPGWRGQRRASVDGAAASGVATSSSTALSAADGRPARTSAHGRWEFLARGRAAHPDRLRPRPLPALPAAAVGDAPDAARAGSRSSGSARRCGRSSASSRRSRSRTRSRSAWQR